MKLRFIFAITLALLFLATPVFAESVTIYLGPGWNIISSPVLEGFSPSEINKGCVLKSGPWSWSLISGEYNKEKYIVPYQGYWVFIKDNCGFSVTGTKITVMPEVRLYKGWNLVSGIGAVTEITGTCQITSGPWWYDNTGAMGCKGCYYKATGMDPSVGYWIRVSEDCILRTAGAPEQPTQPTTPVTVPAGSEPTGWHTSGNKILDPNGNEVKLKSINWQGFEEGSALVLQGVWAAGITEQLDKIKSTGFNSIRIPYTNDILKSGQKPTVGYVDTNKNPPLKDWTSLQALDYVIDEAAKRNLYIILDRHRPTGGSQSALWYTDHVSEQKWIDDWVTLANRYKDKTNVIAFDLHNEPHDPATWGDGNPATDWKMAAEKAGNKILEANPNILIVVEGVQKENNEWYRWGGSLMQIREKPITLNVKNKVVYSPHDYGPGVVKNDNDVMFAASNYPNNLPDYWDSKWGYISKENIAPVWIGEFGVNNTIDGTKEWIWFNTLVNYIDTNNLNFAYWCWSPDRMSPDSGGLYADEWVNLNQKKLNVLKQILD